MTLTAVRGEPPRREPLSEEARFFKPVGDGSYTPMSPLASVPGTSPPTFRVQAFKGIFLRQGSASVVGWAPGPTGQLPFARNK